MKNNQVTKKRVYKGFRNQIDFPNIFESDDLIDNEYIIYDNNNKICRYHASSGQFLPLNTKMDTIKARNLQQKMAIDLLNDGNIPVKTLIGKAGGGKTYLAIQHALRKLMSGETKKIVVVRQPEPVGKDIGYLSGSKEVKLQAWFKPVMDNLEGYGHYIETLIERGTVEFEIPAHMQGRTIPDATIILDEAQLTTIQQIKMIGERVGENSELILCGDIMQTLVDKYVEDNGLAYVINNLAGRHLFGLVMFTKSERSEVAELFANLGGLYEN
jgi:PhoH-like ATPase